MNDQDFIYKLSELWHRYKIYRFGKRVTFKDFMEWIGSLHD